MCIPASLRLDSRASSAVTPGSGNFLARLSGIFSEHVVTAWCDCPHAPDVSIGRPALREPGHSHGRTLDFTLRHRQSGRLCAAGMKCWITWADYRYLRLTEAAQLQGLAGPAFVRFLALARDRAACQVFAGGQPVRVDGAILARGAATGPGRPAAVALGVADVLTVEDMVSDRHAWPPPGWQDFIARRRSWATELSGYLGSPGCSMRAETTSTIIAA